MSLSEFNKMMFKNSNEAKNFMSLLIGHYTQNSASIPILNVFKNLAPEYQKEDKLFAPLFFKYFMTYSINNENYPYFKKYSTLWSDDKKLLIINKNPNFKINDKVDYKNSLVFAKAIITIVRKFDYDLEKYMSGYPFLKEEHDTIEKLIKKDKNKFIENFTKFGIWKSLIIDNYIMFKDFCVKYEFDSMDILKNTLLNENTFVPMMKDMDRFEEFLIDIKSVDNFFINTSFFEPATYYKYNKNKNNENILHVVMDLINFGNEENAFMLLKTYLPEFKSCLSFIMKKDDIYEQNTWNEYIKIINSNNKNKYSEHFTLKTFEGITLRLKNYELNKKLTDKLLSDNKPKTKSVKI